MKKKKLWIIVLLCLLIPLLLYVFYFKNFSHVAKQLKMDLPLVFDFKYEDTHGGFLGDGATFSKMKFSKANGEKLLSQIADYEEWKALPMTKNIDLLLYGGEKSKGEHLGGIAQAYPIPQLSHGYWFFLDRHSEADDPKSDRDLLHRSSYNLTVALYDPDTNTLYYLEFDT